MESLSPKCVQGMEPRRVVRSPVNVPAPACYSSKDCRSDGPATAALGPATLGGGAFGMLSLKDEQRENESPRGDQKDDVSRRLKASLVLSCLFSNGVEQA